MIYLKSLCEKVIEVSNKDIKPPYTTVRTPTILFTDIYSECVQCFSTDYLLIAANSAERLAKALLVLSEVLEEFQPIIERMHLDGRLTDANTLMFSEKAKAALVKANDICRGEQE